jgi:hypothetical protein
LVNGSDAPAAIEEVRRDYPHPFAGTGSNMRAFAPGPEPIDDTQSIARGFIANVYDSAIENENSI